MSCGSDARDIPHFDIEIAFDERVLSAWRQHSHNTSRDFSWMIEARLAAQRRVADRLGLRVTELEHFQRVLKFAGAEDLCRLGEKSKAIKLLGEGFGAAPSLTAQLRAIVRLCEPNPLMKWRKRRRQQRAAKSYGTLIIPAGVNHPS